jgi:zinc transporter ZupT
MLKHTLYVETIKTQSKHNVSTGMAVALFLLGLFLVLMTFLAAFVVTVVLGYILAITAFVGIYMAVKRGGRILPLVLGVVLAVFSLAVLAVVTAAQIVYPDAEIKIQHSV